MTGPEPGEPPDLPGFLLARWLEDAQLATAAIEDARTGWWEANLTIHGDPSVCRRAEPRTGRLAAIATGGPDYGRAISRHMAHWSPVRVQDQVSGLQRLLADHMTVHQLVEDITQPSVLTVCSCHLLRCLALPYAGHPDYLPAWRVTE